MSALNVTLNIAHSNMPPRQMKFVWNTVLPNNRSSHLGPSVPGLRCANLFPSGQIVFPAGRDL
ncbi:hypothetical protein SB768_31640, partial [Burkholderia sp. SIMBA_043]|uniref:hypothetical protein n=1 Tax=Burkholderia sp. SIMBA_043 TaxID=3085784 RepID=UPI00397ABCB2